LALSFSLLDFVRFEYTASRQRPFRARSCARIGDPIDEMALKVGKASATSLPLTVARACPALPARTFALRIPSGVRSASL